MEIKLLEDADDDLAFWIKSANKSGRRINQEHRLVYEIDEGANLILIHSLKGHY